MSRLRILGPRQRLDEVFQALQDLNLLHLSAPAQAEPLAASRLEPRQERERAQLRRALADTEHDLDKLGATTGMPATQATAPTAHDFARWARIAGRVRRALDRLASRAADLDEQRALILKYQHFFSAFRAMLE